MGVLSGRDLFSAKWITAVITDAASRMFFVPIKFVVGDFFVAEIERQIYCFKIDGSRIKTYRHTLVKSFRVLQYDTTHYLPISAGDTRELAEVLRKNSLPKVSHNLFKTMKILGSREKEEFTPHKLPDLVKEVSKFENEYSEEVRNLTNYLTHLKVDQILTPVRGVSEFLETDVLATDSQFLGTIVSSYQRLDIEHKKVTNTPITGKFPWIKIIAIIAIIGLVIGIGWWVYDSGVFSGGIPGLNFGQGPTTEQLLDKYPTPEALKTAVDRGEIKYDALPKEIKDMIDNVKLPQAQ